MLAVNQTTRSYTGKPGCMCGCKGNYNEGERARKLAITQLLKDPRVRYGSWGDEGAVFVVTATRNRTLYLTAEGVAAVQAMGVLVDA